MSERFLYFSSFKDYENRCLDGKDDIKRFKALSRKEKAAEIRKVDELIHVTTRNTDYGEETSWW